MSVIRNKIFSYRPQSDKPLNYREKLDLVLFALRNHNGEQRYGGLFIVMRVRYHANLDEEEFKRVLNKLKKDGFILVKTVDIYSITLDGYYFKGYVAANKSHIVKIASCLFETGH